ILRSKKRPRRTLRSGRGSRTNSNTSRQIQARVIDACASRDEAVVFAIDAAQKLGTRGECAHVCMVDDDGRFQSKWTFEQTPSSWRSRMRSKRRLQKAEGSPARARASVSKSWC